MFRYGLFLYCLIVIIQKTFPVRAASKCEVCENMVSEFLGVLKSSDAADSKDKTAQKEQFIEFCFEREKLKTKHPNLSKYEREYKFCDNLGAYPHSPTSILNSFIDQIQLGLPADRICSKIQRLDSQICELSYEKEIDLKTVNLKKLKVRDLKKILSRFDEVCTGCVEKSDFIKKIEEIKNSRNEL